MIKITKKVKKNNLKGEGNITSEQFEIIKTHLEKVSTEEFQNDIQLAPIWVRKTLQNA